MFEIDDPVRRARVLASLGGVEDNFLHADRRRPRRGVPEGDIERTREDGKTSSVHFLRFPLTPAADRRVPRPADDMMVGCDHPAYGHMAVMPPPVRQALAQDFA